MALTVLRVPCSLNRGASATQDSLSTLLSTVECYHTADYRGMFCRIVTNFPLPCP